MIHGFCPSILLNLPSLCNNYFLFVFVIFQNNIVLGCPNSTTTIKVHGTVHQTHGTFHQIPQKYWCKLLEQLIKPMVQFIEPFQKYWWTCQIFILRRRFRYNYWYQATNNLPWVTHWKKYGSYRYKSFQGKNTRSWLAKS